jgi:tetratricopeptide (TPR) repeat protein
MIEVSGFLIFLLICLTLVSAIIKWNEREKVDKLLFLYGIALILQVLIFIFNFQEKHQQRTAIYELKKETLDTKVVISINEENRDVKDAIVAIVFGDEDVAINTINDAYNRHKKHEEFYNKLFNTACKHKKNGNNSVSQIYFKLCDYIYIADKKKNKKKYLVDNHPKVIFNLAILEQYFSRDKKKDEIIKQIKKALELDPKIMEAHISLGKIFVSSGVAKAEYHFKEVLKLDSKNEEAMKSLAFLYYSNNQYDDAIGLFKELIKRKPDEDDYHYALSNCYYEKGSYQEAKEAIDKAIEYDGENPIYLKLKVSILENPDYKEPQSVIVAINQRAHEPEELILDDTKGSASPTDRPGSTSFLPIKKYPGIKATIVNASRSKNAAKELGYRLHRRYGIRFAFISVVKRYRDTVIYYNNSNEKIVAEEFEKWLPGEQKVAPLPKDVNLTKYKDIVIFIGNDYAKILNY